MQSKIKFIHNGAQVNVIEFDEQQVRDTIEAKVYMLAFSQDSGYYLTYVKEKFELPEKLYGTTQQRVDRILKSFANSSKGLGVLATGDKGSGKTLLTSKICNDSGLPVVIINQAYTGPQFELFINRLGQCVLLFDEFGKTYKTNEDGDAPQEGILSLLDGSTSNKRLILMTENDTFLINDYILGRSGRVRYHFEYSKLEEDVITCYCKEQECSQEFVEEVLEFCRTSTAFSFDTLSTLVREHKEYGESLQEFLPFINVDNRNRQRLDYFVQEVFSEVDGKLLSEEYHAKMGYDEYSGQYYLRSNKDGRSNTYFDFKDHFISKDGDTLVLTHGIAGITVVLKEVFTSKTRYNSKAV